MIVSKDKNPTHAITLGLGIVVVVVLLVLAWSVESRPHQAEAPEPAPPPAQVVDAAPVPPVLTPSTQLPSLPVKAIDLVLSAEVEAQLDALRQKAMDENMLLDDGKRFFNGRLQAGDESLRMRIRLKGDKNDHWRKDNWSSRIELRGKDRFWGMSKFSLQPIDSRGMLASWLYYRALKLEGIIAPRFDFVEVSVNGKSMGLFCLEEHFDTNLLENNERREGPILKFNESLFWIATYGADGLYQMAEIDGFGLNRIAKNPALKRQYERGVTLLGGFRDGTYTTQEAFDVDLLATLYALNDVHGGHHQVWHNMRCYLNPVTDRLEPIGFDADPGLITARFMLTRTDPAHFPIFSRHLASPELKRAYQKALMRVSSQAYFDSYIAAMEPALGEAFGRLQTHFPGDPGITIEHIMRNSEAIRQLLQPHLTLRFHLEEQADSQTTFAISPVQMLDVEWLGLRWPGGEWRLSTPLLVTGINPDKPVTWQHWTGTLPTHVIAALADGATAAQIVATTRLAGCEQLHTTPLIRTPSGGNTLIRKDDPLRQPGNVQDFPWLAVNDTTRTITSRPGPATLEQTLIIPPGYTVMLSAGTQLELAAGCSIISRSPITAIGSENAPITIRGQEGSGGLYVDNRGQVSQLRHVHALGLDRPTANGWELTGAVTINQGDITIEDCQFLNARSEDSLNLMKTRFTLANSLIADSAFDALDVDFGTGTIAHCQVLRSGNDGLDFSGCRVTIDHVTIVDAGDKGLSCGEDSRALVRSITIDGAAIGVAAKDLSQIQIGPATIRRATVGLTAYQKKEVFGGGIILATQLALADCKNNALCEKGSSIVIDGKHASATPAKLAEIFYGTEN